jgi:chemotaxis protein methyltransferase CheR
VIAAGRSPLEPDAVGRSLIAAGGGVGQGLPSIGDAEFGLLRALVHQEAGIFLSDAKKLLLAGRLARRLRSLGLRSFMEYYRRVRADPEELLELLDAVATNETHFFREPRQFELLERDVFPRWKAEAEAGRRPPRVRAWSAGCSSGEEPYSLAMLLLSHFPPASGWKVEVLATDLSRRVLAQAEAGVWPLSKAHEIPPRFLREFMLRGVRSREGTMAAGPELRAAVRCARLNLADPELAAGDSFDLLLCRNVLIYFHPADRVRVVERLLAHLEVGGYILLGHAESLAEMAGVGRGTGHTAREAMRSVGPMVYVRTTPAAGPAGERRA